MTTATIGLPTASATMADGTASNAAPQYRRIPGTDTSPHKVLIVLDFDPSTQESCFFIFTMPQNYASAPVLRVQWMANATSGNVIWGAQLGAITPADADTPIEHAGAAATTATTNVNATEANRLTQSTITFANLDSVAAGDLVVIRLYRDAATDTCSVDAALVDVSFDFTTT